MTQPASRTRKIFTIKTVNYTASISKIYRGPKNFIRINIFTKNYQRQPTCSLPIITIFIRSFLDQDFGIKSVYKFTSIRNQNDQIYAKMIFRTILLVILIHASSARPIPGQKGQELSKVIFKKNYFLKKKIFSQKSGSTRISLVVHAS